MPEYARLCRFWEHPVHQRFFICRRAVFQWGIGSIPSVLSRAFSRREFLGRLAGRGNSSVVQRSIFCAITMISIPGYPLPDRHRCRIKRQCHSDTGGNHSNPSFFRYFCGTEITLNTAMLLPPNSKKRYEHLCHESHAQ